jgi:hypothetical protein
LCRAVLLWRRTNANAAYVGHLFAIAYVWAWLIFVPLVIFRGRLVLGLLWTGWHLPLFLYPGWTSSPLWVYVLFMTGQSVISTYGTNLARFGIITPIAMHAAFNTVSRFLGGLFADTQPTHPYRSYW